MPAMLSTPGRHQSRRTATPPARLTGLGEQHARQAEPLAQQGAGRAADLLALHQGAQAVAQRDEKRLLAFDPAQLLHLLFDQAARQMLFGNVGALGEDAGDAAVFDDGLVDHVDVALLALLAGAAPHPDRDVVAEVLLAGGVDRVEHLDQALVGQVGQRLAHRPPRILARPEQRHHRVVDELEHVAGAAHHGHEAGRPGEQGAQALDVGAQVQVGLGHVAGALQQAALLGQHCVFWAAGAGRLAPPLHFGDVDRMLQHQFELARLVEHRRVRDGPVALLEAAARARDVEAQQRQGVGPAARHHALDRGHHLALGVGVGREGVQGPAADDVFQLPSGRGQVGAVGMDDHEPAVHDQVGVGRCVEQCAEAVVQAGHGRFRWWRVAHSTVVLPGKTSVTSEHRRPA
jgi:hypothetical protein